jgi:hypothetical protein
VTVVISAVVEGHGDRESVGVLVRRLADQVRPGLVPSVPSPLRVPKDRLIRSGELERTVALAARKVTGQGGVLVLVDADDDAPCVLGPDLQQRAQATPPDVPVAVVLARREYESWFLAAAESLATRRGLVASLGAPPRPEEVRGAKEWLGDRMEGSRRYKETLDQPALTAVFDIGMARHRSDSFDKCCREITRLLGA